jgi:DNA-binding protein YbaB
MNSKNNFKKSNVANKRGQEKMKQDLEKQLDEMWNQHEKDMERLAVDESFEKSKSEDVSNHQKILVSGSSIDNSVQITMNALGHVDEVNIDKTNFLMGTQDKDEERLCEYKENLERKILYASNDARSKLDQK